jgi:sugar/nucleoside kinase (ribokinase family)
MRDVVGAERLLKIVAEARLIGMVNWTMLPHMNDLWRNLIKMLGPQGRRAKGAQRKFVFIDLADPEKRTLDDLRGALKLCTQFQGVADVVLGLNLKEAATIAGALDVAVGANPEAEIEALARALRAKLGLYAVVIHPRGGAAAARQRGGGGGVESARFAGPFVAKPKLSTGAGDNFNSGFCLGLLAGLPLDQALCVGTATSGYYVRHAGSPKLAELIKFCRNLPEPQAG